MSYLVKTISFEQCVDFWKENQHFDQPSKRYLEYVQTLGPHKREIQDPERHCYGLFISGQLIGVTQLSQWSRDWVRYRTIHILKEYRGQNLGWQLIEEAFYRDWHDAHTLFGWVKREHVDWSLRHGFEVIDDNLIDNHIGMIKKMRSS